MLHSHYNLFNLLMYLFNVYLNKFVMKTGCYSHRLNVYFNKLEHNKKCPYVIFLHQVVSVNYYIYGLFDY